MVTSLTDYSKFPQLQPLCYRLTNLCISTRSLSKTSPTHSLFLFIDHSSNSTT